MESDRPRFAERIAVDLDGVLCHGRGRYEDRIPDEIQRERLRELHSSGLQVVIWTARDASFEGRRRTENWLRRHGFPFDRLVLGKPILAAIVDDHAVPEIPEDLADFTRRIKSGEGFRP